MLFSFLEIDSIRSATLSNFLGVVLPPLRLPDFGGFGVLSVRPVLAKIALIRADIYKINQ